MSENANTDAGAQAANDGGEQQQQVQTRTYTQEEFDAAVKPLRQEAAQYRTKAKEFEASLEKYKDGMTAEDAAKLRSEYTKSTELLTAAETRALNADIRATAKDLGYADGSDAVQLIDRDALKFDKNGDVTNLKELLGDLLKAKPHLRGAAPNVDAGAKGATQAKADMNAMFRGAIRR